MLLYIYIVTESTRSNQIGSSSTDSTMNTKKENDPLVLLGDIGGIGIVYIIIAVLGLCICCIGCILLHYIRESNKTRAKLKETVENNTVQLQTVRTESFINHSSQIIYEDTHKYNKRLPSVMDVENENSDNNNKQHPNNKTVIIYPNTNESMGEAVTPYIADNGSIQSPNSTNIPPISPNIYNNGYSANNNIRHETMPFHHPSSQIPAIETSQNGSHQQFNNINRSRAQSAASSFIPQYNNNNNYNTSRPPSATVTGSYYSNNGIILQQNTFPPSIQPQQQNYGHPPQPNQPQSGSQKSIYSVHPHPMGTNIQQIPIHSEHNQVRNINVIHPQQQQQQNLMSVRSILSDVAKRTADENSDSSSTHSSEMSDSSDSDGTQSDEDYDDDDDDDDDDDTEDDDEEEEYDEAPIPNKNVSVDNISFPQSPDMNDNHNMDKEENNIKINMQLHDAMDYLNQQKNLTMDNNTGSALSLWTESNMDNTSRMNLNESVMTMDNKKYSSQNSIAPIDNMLGNIIGLNVNDNDTPISINDKKEHFPNTDTLIIHNKQENETV